MAFKNWQIGLHLQQQEAVAVAIVRSAKECLLHRWWRLPLENDIIKDGRIVDVQRLANTLLPWSRELPQRHHIMLAFPASRTLQRSFPRPSMSLGEREQMAWLSGTMARELDMDPDSLRFDYSEDALSPAYNVTAAQSKELATLLTLAERLRVHVSAITPDASALQRFLPFLPSHQQCLAWRDNEQWLWATRYSWGRKLAVGMTSAKELAAALSVDPESVALCGEGGFDPGGGFCSSAAATATRWRLCHRAGAGAWEGVLMNPPINFLPWRQQRRTAFLRFWLLMFVAPLLLAVGITLILRLTSNAEARVNAVLLQAEQQLARSLQITKPRLLERQQLREQRLQRQRQRQFTRDWQSALEALAALLPEHAWLTTISWQQGTLEIKGLTTSITALNALETSLRQDASFHLNQRGATQQDAQGRWQFEYQLTRKVSDEHVL